MGSSPTKATYPDVLGIGRHRPLKMVGPNKP